MTAYYNEIDPYAAQWLRNLIQAGHIAPGIVDERSIEDVFPSDLRGFTQCHFFAGIGVWSLALRCSGWADSRPVWTGSCPCQPFSSAGKGAAFDDERHLWPAFHHLIKECKPAIVLGEQVASKDADPWIDLVQADVEAMGYAFGAIPFPSASIGAPHIRDRLYWLASNEDQTNGVEHSMCIGRQRREAASPGHRHDGATPERTQGEHGPGVTSTHRISEDAPGPTNGLWRDADWLFCRDGKWRPVEPGTFPLVDGTSKGVGRSRTDWHTPAGQEGQGHRAGRLRGYGNAINAESARVFVSCVMEVAP